MSQGPNDTAALEARVAAVETQLQRYKAAFDAISQGVCLFDNEQRVIVGNRPYAEIYGLSPDQIPPGTTLGEITERRAAVGNCPMATGAYLSYVESINAKRQDRDWSVRLDDGRTIRIHYRPMPDGGWLTTHEDVTDRQEKRLLIEERVSLQSLIDVVPDNLWVKDVESRFVVANRATALRMGRASPQELIGKSDLELCPWETAQKYLADEREVIETGRPMIDSEEYILAPDGEKVWISTTKAPLRNERGEVVSIIGVSRDVTRRRLADALREGHAEILQMIVGGAPAEIVLEELVHLVESQSNGTVVAIVPLEDKGRKFRRGRDVAGGNRSPPWSAPRRTARRGHSSPRLGHRPRHRVRSRVGGAARTILRAGTARLLVDAGHAARRRAARRAGGLRPRGARAK